MLGVSDILTTGPVAAVAAAAVAAIASPASEGGAQQQGAGGLTSGGEGLSVRRAESIRT